MESSVWLELPPKKSFSCAFSSLASASTTSNLMSSHRYMKYWIESGNIISNDRFVLFLLCTEMKEEENKKTYFLVIGFSLCGSLDALFKFRWNRLLLFGNRIKTIGTMSVERWIMVTFSIFHLFATELKSAQRLNPIPKSTMLVDVIAQHSNIHLFNETASVSIIQLFECWLGNLIRMNWFSVTVI